MSGVTIIGIDLAKRIFHLHGADGDGSIVFRKKLSRNPLLGFKSQVPRCVIAMEACATAHGWGRDFEKLGHELLDLLGLLGKLPKFDVLVLGVAEQTRNPPRIEDVEGELLLS